ncbi:parB-like partition protein (plasmid) [Stanieria cyanosphaera PCC 7437]|uniref:ParB-like partition protein n=1 Tax=Stanieria cyanosphaera (strain ATCC 29371 / PCC 7437) TaxID=111780 RepID=K9Y076_STAC7|nr:ParB/RepB/Spo0J family partition protein [Stanieria cyanosphaera]AFZ38235.1 parB-like partition protein [Stanieria cyanosphaera PCC 7437]
MARTRKSVEDFIFKGEKNGAVQIVFLTDLKLPALQPRQYFDEAKLQELAQTIKNHGVLEPLLVRSLPRQNQYELVAGGRRYRAAALAGLTEVPVIVLELSDEQALEIAIVENLQREDLNPVEETEGILHLLAQRLKTTVTEVSPLLHQIQKQLRGRAANNVIGSEIIEQIQAIFESLGLMELDSFIGNRLPLLNLPEDVLEALRSGQIEYTKAKAIATLKDEELRKELLSDAITNSLSLSQIKEKVNALKPVKQKEELQNRFDVTYKIAKKSKQLWQDPKKRKKLESLLSQLEQLIESEAKSEVSKTKDESTSETSTEESKEETGLTDGQLAELLGVSNLLISDYRVKGQKPRGQVLAKALTEQWEVKGEVWVQKS